MTENHESGSADIKAGSVRAAKAARSPKGIGLLRNRASGVLTMAAVAGLVGVAAIPAYALTPQAESAITPGAALSIGEQTLAVEAVEVTLQARDSFTGESAADIQAREAAAAEAAAAEAAAAAQTAAAEEARVAAASVPASELPAGSGASGLLAAALAQLGQYQDCTALVERALAAIGYSVPDLGPMQFGAYGYQVTDGSIAPGDIMMRPGHVAIYAGNGMAVHGGWLGNQTVLTGADSNPANYSVIIRLP